MTPAATIRARVLAAIAADRAPGFSFTGHLLDTTWPHIGRDDVRVRIPFGAHCDDGSGAMEITALLMTLDAALGTATRLFIVPGERIATAQLYAQFTGAPLTGDLEVATAFTGMTQGDAVGQMLSRGTASMNGVPVCHGNASFVRLPPPPGARALAPLPWQSAEQSAAAPDPAQLDAREAQILAHCDAVLAGAWQERGFLRSFWGIDPAPHADGAVGRAALGPHMANRVGHVQGGILLGLAVHAAKAAAPRHPVLSNLSAWFISPGRGPFLEARATPLHSGRSFAVVKTEVTGEGGVRVLEAVTAHASAA
ncbi:MAG: PaaI family thioesterase [Burkholderiales bacterium]|nr:PaaI family thioesterase [Burkholderiales bacterium]